MHIPTLTMDLGDFVSALMLGGMLSVMGAGKTLPNGAQAFSVSRYLLTALMVMLGVLLSPALAHGAAPEGSPTSLVWRFVGMLVGMAPGTAVILVFPPARRLWRPKKD
jgi:hypothetical protein